MGNIAGYLSVAFLSTVLLVPSVASAVPLGAYESARSDPAKSTHMLNEAYSIAVARTVSGLRSPAFTDGKVKSPQRLQNDRKCKRHDRLTDFGLDRSTSCICSRIRRDRARWGEPSWDVAPVRRQAGRRLGPARILR